MESANIAIGAHVSDRDGRPLGRVTRFVVDPGTRQLDALVVGDEPFSTERVVDIARVRWQADGGVFLSVDADEAGHLPPFGKRQVAQVRRPDTAPVLSSSFDPVVGSPYDPYEGDATPALHGETVFETPLPETAIVQTISSIPEGSVVLTGRTAIVTANGYKAGHVHALALDERHRVVGLVMTSFLFLVFKHRVRVPVSSVAALTHDRIVLTQGLDALTDAINEADVEPA